MSAENKSPETSISLRGSAELVAEFFKYGVNNVLFQRGVYPPETFTRVSKYGLTMLVSTDPEVQSYLDKVLADMSVWLSRGVLDRVVVVIQVVETKRVVERWSFDIATDCSSNNTNGGSDIAPASIAESKPDQHAKIISQIRALVLQISSTVTVLPLLEERCSFDVLIYTKKETEAPSTWEESGPRNVIGGAEVGLRSFDTSVHKVGARVAYAADDL